MIDDKTLTAYINKFSHTISIINLDSLSDEQLKEIEEQMKLALEGKREPLNDEEVYPDLPKDAFT